MAENKPVDKNLQRIRKSMENDINGTINTADLLSGKGAIGTTRINSSKKIKDPFAELDNSKNINKFLKFIEDRYEKDGADLELKKEKI